MELLLAFANALIQGAVALLGARISIVPPKTKRLQHGCLAAFIVLGCLGVIVTVGQQRMNSHAHAAQIGEQRTTDGEQRTTDTQTADAVVSVPPTTIDVTAAPPVPALVPETLPLVSLTHTALRYDRWSKRIEMRAVIGYAGTAVAPTVVLTSLVLGDKELSAGGSRQLVLVPQNQFEYSQVLLLPADAYDRWAKRELAVRLRIRMMFNDGGQMKRYFFEGAAQPHLTALEIVISNLHDYSITL